jgi:hypothetical protein
MKAKVGLHFFGRNGNTWGIWIYDCVDENGFTSAQKVTNCYTFNEALKKTYQLNGWGEPRNIKQRF